MPAEALGECGYQILTESHDAGVELFVKERRNRLLFFQGHPEYDTQTLGREYVRDVRRYLHGERETYSQRAALLFQCDGEGDARPLPRSRAQRAQTRC